jgi:Family of unknown function (DUF6065)
MVSHEVDSLRKMRMIMEERGKKRSRDKDRANAPKNGNPQMVVDTKEPTLIAYAVNQETPMRLVRATSTRDWMDATGARFAYRCLPLLIANQSGWFVLNSHTIQVTWTGGDNLSSVQIEYLDGSPPFPALSHFGHGILTWSLPYLFHTSPGYNLLVRGPANWPKDGAYPLEGIVESDWCPATFTMNWKLTRPNHSVTFDIDEPICMILPQHRGELEGFQPEIQAIASEPVIYQGYREWSQSRGQFLADLEIPGSGAAEKRWQKDYFRGMTTDGVHIPEHETKLTLRDFVLSNEPQQVET